MSLVYGPQVPITFHYRFRFDDGAQRDFTIRLDPSTLTLVLDPRRELPAWTELANNKCPHCPLPDAPGARCPAAVSLVEMADLFSNACSYDEVEVTITGDTRQYAKRVSLQDGVSSLAGLLMATSGCPMTAKLRPMVRLHLPFATDWETTYRVLSMYLLAQFLLERRGGKPDWSLANLSTFYQDLRKLNRSVAKRLAQAGSGDAHLNALLVLDAQADIVSFSVDERCLEELEALFAPYLNPPSA